MYRIVSNSKMCNVQSVDLARTGRNFNMPRGGITAYDLLISCPGDVVQFVDVIRECVDSFNRTIGKVNNTEIVAKHWSTDSYPQSGDRAQELLNTQFVRDCDAAVALFWTKFGTPTDKYGSGTEEEIEEMLSSDKQVFMYFLDAPVNPSTIDMEQYKKVGVFKKKYENKGIYVVVKDENALRQQFTNHLAMHFLPLIAGEKTQFEKKPLPILKIKDAELMDDTQTAIRTSCFAECKLVNEKRSSCIAKLRELQIDYLSSRDIKESDSKAVSPIINNDLKKLLENATLTSATVSDAEISEEWKKTIIEFALDNNISLDSRFWNVGNLKKKTSLIVPFYGGGTSFDGNDEEKNRYDAIQKLYWDIVEYQEYKQFFVRTDQQNFINLVVANNGDTFDEDIDVKLIIKKGNILHPNNIPIPGINIIEEIMQMNFLKYVYEIKASDTIDSYTGYPLQKPNFDYHIPDILGGVSARDGYEKHKKQFKNDLERIFCYRYYVKDECDILTFHIVYLKHNTAIAFPSALVFKNIPEKIEYEISSKFVPNVIKGNIQIAKENIG